MTEIAGSSALVCGGGGGIGRAIALSLARRGAKLLLVDIAPDRLDEVQAAIARTGGTARTFCCDVGASDFADRLADAAGGAGAVDILVNNVGLLSGGHVEDIPPCEWERILTVNVLSMVRATHRFLPAMLERGRGHIVNTASFSGLYPYACDRLPYAASKGAVVTMTEGLALYLRPKGIGVTLLCPGPVRTNIGQTAASFTEGITRRPPPFPLLDPERVGEQVAQAVETNRFFLPTDEDVVPWMVERARDMDGFIAAQIARMAEDDGKGAEA